MIPIVLGVLAGATSYIASSLLKNKAQQAGLPANTNMTGFIANPTAQQVALGAPVPGGIVIPGVSIMTTQGVVQLQHPKQPMAVVTTPQAAPDGDLIVRDAPNGNQIGGADKGATLQVLQYVDATWAQVQTQQGVRFPAVTGFAQRQFLVETSDIGDI